MLLFLSTVEAFAQTYKIDSLMLLLKSSKPDTNKVNTLNALAEELKNDNPDTAIYFANDAIAVATKLNYKIGIADALLCIARAKANIGKTEEGLKNCNDALKFYDQLSALKSSVDQSKILQQKSNTYNTKGIIYIMQGNYPESLKNLFSALSICTKFYKGKGLYNCRSAICIVSNFLQ